MDWRHRAACLDEDPELFFPIGNTGPALLQIEEAKAVCRRCPVMETCLQWALESGQDAGVWGGGAFAVPATMAKAGLNNMTQSLAVEWGKYGIRLNGIAPCATGTPFMEESAKKLGQAFMDAYPHPLLGRMPTAAASLRRVVNATGIVVHTNLGRAPLSEAAVEALGLAAGATDVDRVGGRDIGAHRPRAHFVRADLRKDR